MPTPQECIYTLDLLQKYQEPLPNPLLTKAPVAKGREPEFSCFPRNQRGTEGGQILAFARGLFRMHPYNQASNLNATAA